MKFYPNSSELIEVFCKIYEYSVNFTSTAEEQKEKQEYFKKISCDKEFVLFLDKYKLAHIVNNHHIELFNREAARELYREVKKHQKTFIKSVTHL